MLGNDSEFDFLNTLLSEESPVVQASAQIVQGPYIVALRQFYNDAHSAGIPVHDVADNTLFTAIDTYGPPPIDPSAGDAIKKWKYYVNAMGAQPTVPANPPSESIGPNALAQFLKYPWPVSQYGAKPEWIDPRPKYQPPAPAPVYVEPVAPTPVFIPEIQPYQPDWSEPVAPAPVYAEPAIVPAVYTPAPQPSPLDFMDTIKKAKTDLDTMTWLSENKWLVVAGLFGAGWFLSRSWKR